ncbi:MAG: DNA-processing protein DprA [Patescibacteria group bacterium]|nr:DNA-processing protein DprA [Patescibacteria group bacterium]MCL5432196.1 DNA-processing protein DprA [Patescibacteria group bacterium]
MVEVLKITDAGYPPQLKNIFCPPKTLYVKSQLGSEEVRKLVTGKIIAIVGTRKMTKKGEKNTAKITKELVKQRFIICSGMALGIDGVAHQTAIENNGQTIAVLGAGVDVVYPPQHRELYNSILAHGGAIIAEVPPGRRVSRELFPARNRIISGLSQAVIVIEAPLKSGALITARLALDQGREVLAVPGSPGCDYLIAQGAVKIL